MPFPNTKVGRARKKRYRRSVKRKHVYERLRKKGHSKASAARISNAGRTRGGRRRMARKGARTRRR